MNQQIEKKLYRGEHAIGGVCSGIADYFAVDAIIVRIAWILLSVFSVGLAVVLYVILWLVIPNNPEQKKSTVVDVDPVSVESDKYHNVVCDPLCRGKSERFGVHAGTGHVPPKPPYVLGKESSTSFFDKDTFNRVQNRGNQEIVSIKEDGSSFKLAALLGLALMLFFVAVARLFTVIIPDVTITDFWPFVFVIVGVVIVAVPAKRWSFALRICGFLACFEACLFLLPFTVGIVSLDSLSRISNFALAIWVVCAVLAIFSLVSPNEVLVMVLIALIMVGTIVTFTDIGVFERVVALINLNPPHKKYIPGPLMVHS